MFKAVFVGFIITFLLGTSFAQSGRVQIYSESDSQPEKSETKTKIQPATVENKTKTDDEIIRVDTDLVIIPAQITERGGKAVTGLKKEEFKIFENGIEQEIAYFSGDEQPFTVALVLDMSYSSVFKIKEIQDAAFAFINQLRPEDKVMILSFDEEVRVLCEPTNDRKILRLAIEATKIASGTSLYWALDTVLSEKFDKVSGRRAIVLLSDGVDTSSARVTASDILRNVRTDADILIYPIQYDTYDDVQKSRKESAQVFYDDDDRPYTIEMPRKKGEREEDYKQANEFFKELSGQTGGKIFRVSSSTNLNQAFAKIADELRKIYSLGYYPSGERKAGVRYAVKVRVYRPNLLVRARNSFFRQQNRNSVK